MLILGYGGGHEKLVQLVKMPINKEFLLFLKFTPQIFTPRNI